MPANTIYPVKVILLYMKEKVYRKVVTETN